ncbi:MAG: cell division protein ZapA [Chitinispirillales bacterium]|jgi:cell division protein ZapA|nr:cell division protein ZapA [Chitinispirillales bacterium]
MGSESIRVMIFGTEYSIKGDADTETTRLVAQYVNSKIAEIQEMTASRDNMKIAVLSALNIAGELFETKAKYEEELKKVQQCQDKIKSLNNKIETFC